MTVKELKKIIAEEYRYWMAEQPADMDMPDLPAGPPVKVGAGDVDPGGEDAEATLKDIFDMLKDYFEGGGDEPVADVEDDEGPDEKPEEEEEEEDEKEETNESKKRKMRKIVRESLKLKKGKKLKKLKTTKFKNKRNNSGVLAERFKKLANIVK